MFSPLTQAKEFSIEQYHVKIDFINDGHTNKADDVRVITIMIAGLFLLRCEENSIFSKMIFWVFFVILIEEQCFLSNSFNGVTLFMQFL